MNYFRITGFNPKENYCFIIDSNGRFEKLWQFSSYLLNKGLKVLSACSEENIVDLNITKASPDTDNLILRATAKGMPQHGTHEIDGVIYKTIMVADKRYIDNRQ